LLDFVDFVAEELDSSSSYSKLKTQCQWYGCKRNFFMRFLFLHYSNRGVGTKKIRERRETFQFLEISVN